MWAGLDSCDKVWNSTLSWLDYVQTG